MNSPQNILHKNLALREINADAPHRLSAFYSESYLRARSANWGYFVTGTGYVVPMLLFRRLAVRYAILTGDLAPLDPSLPPPSQADYDQLLDLRQHVDFCQPPTANSISRLVPHGDMVQTMGLGTFVVDLSQSKDTLFAALHSKHRNVVRKAEKDGIRIAVSRDYADAFYAMLKAGAKRQGRGVVKRSEYDALLQTPPHFCELVVALDSGGDIQGGALFLQSPQHCHYLYGASIDNPHTGAQNLLHWSHMLAMKAKGVRHYDFMGVRLQAPAGSKYEGIYRFKERFGGQLVQGYIWWADFRPLRARILRGLQTVNHKLRG